MLKIIKAGENILVVVGGVVVLMNIVSECIKK